MEDSCHLEVQGIDGESLVTAGVDVNSLLRSSFTIHKYESSAIAKVVVLCEFMTVIWCAVVGMVGRADMQ